MSGWRPRTRLALFAVVLLVGFGAATAVGALGEPVDRTADDAHGGAHGAAHPADVAAVGGLSAVEDGYRLVVLDADLHAGGVSAFAFEIVDAHGERLVEYELRHEKPLHLVVARDDLSAELHVHPQLDTTGVWHVDLPLTSAGRWRAIADFAPAGSDDPKALAVDLLVPGQPSLQPLPAPSAHADVDGYHVTVAGRGAAGEERTLAFTVTREGRPVELEPHLGARGHLVVLREGDLAYLHVHPTSDATTEFAATFPTAGRYRLFLEFKHDGIVHTAAFTMEVGP
jgi:hypothetical protein